MPSIACPIFDSSVIPGSPPPDSLKSSTASLPHTQSFRASTFSLTTAKRFEKTLHWSHRNATLASYISSSSCHGGPELDSGFGPHGRGRGCERLRPRAHHRLCCACWSGSRHHQRLLLHLHRLPRRSAACPGHLRHQARLRRRVPGSPRPGRLHRHPRVRPGHHQPPAHSPPRNRGAVRDQGHPYRRPHRQHQQVLLAGAQDRRCLRLP